MKQTLLEEIVDVAFILNDLLSQPLLTRANDVRESCPVYIQASGNEALLDECDNVMNAFDGGGRFDWT